MLRANERSAASIPLHSSRALHGRVVLHVINTGNVLQKTTINAEWATVCSSSRMCKRLSGPRKSLDGFPIPRLTLLKCNQCCEPCHKAGEAIKQLMERKQPLPLSLRFPRTDWPAEAPASWQLYLLSSYWRHTRPRTDVQQSRTDYVTSAHMSQCHTSLANRSTSVMPFPQNLILS